MSISPVNFSAAIQTPMDIGSAAAAGLVNPKVGTLALGVLALSSLPKASAGPIAFWTCYSLCIAEATAATFGVATPVAIAACNAICLPLLAAPCP